MMRVSKITRVERITALLFLVLTIAIGCGCAYTTQTATLRPDFTVAQATLGNGAEVLVSAVDERPQQEFGRRGTGMVRGAAIHSNQDIERVFSDAVSDGLTELGFRPVRKGSAARSLKVEIRQIDYETSTGFWTGGVHTHAAIKVFARNGEERIERFYRSSEEDRVLFVPGAGSNEEMINAVVNEVLIQLFADYGLIELLAKGTN